MPLPVLPIAAAAGLAALLVAGSKESAAKAPASAAGAATNTVASTNGENGGATAPSHSDVTSTAVAGNQPTDVKSSAISTKADAAPGSLSTKTAGTFTQPANVETGQESAFQSPSWDFTGAWDALREGGVTKNVEAKAISASAELGTGAASKVW